VVHKHVCLVDFFFFGWISLNMSLYKVDLPAFRFVLYFLFPRVWA